MNPSLTTWSFVIAPLAAAACSEAGGPAGRITIDAAALSYAAIDRACYDLEVRAGPDATSPLVWSRDGVCSDRFGNGPGGGIAWIGSCDASAGDHRVTIRLAELWSDGELLDDWVPPPPFVRADVPCDANSDTRVEASFVVMRAAEQGFLDLAVGFEDIFCSAKVDCLTGDDALLHDGDGARGDTVVVALTCDDQGGPPHLLMDDLLVVCDDLPVWVDPTLGPGRYPAYDDPSGVTFGAQEHQGAHDRMSYWTLAIGLGAASPPGPCRLTTRMTATSEDSGGDLTTTPYTSYPVIEVDVALAVDPDGSLRCDATGLDAGGDAPSHVSTTYVDRPDTFAPLGAPFAGCFDPASSDDHTSRCAATTAGPDPCPLENEDPNDGLVLVGSGAACALASDPLAEHTPLSRGPLFVSFDEDGIGTPLAEGDGFVLPVGPGYPGDQPLAANPAGDGDGIVWQSAGVPPTYEGDVRDCFGAPGIAGWFADHPSGALVYRHTLTGAAEHLTIERADGSVTETTDAATPLGADVTAAVLCLDPIGTGPSPAHVSTESYVVALVPEGVPTVPATPSTGPDDPYTNLAPPPTLREIAVGASHACAVMSSGTVDCWGLNGSGEAQGQLGNGVRGGVFRISSPVQGLPAPAIDVAAGEAHSCTLLADGQVFCWGYDRMGQVGDGENTSQVDFVEPSPVRAGALAGAVSIAAGARHTCAALDDGTAWCWGAATDQRLGGTGDGALPLQVDGLDAAAEVVAMDEGACALRQDGTVWCWGTLWGGDPSPFAGLTGVMELGAGGDQMCAVFADGTAECWRDGVAQGLGLTGVVDIAPTRGHACAVRGAGEIWCWGDNDRGQLGDGTTIANPTPRLVPGLPGGLTRVAVGGDQSCARDDAGHVWCWGANESGQLGLGTQIDARTPEPMDVLAVRPRQLSLSQGIGCARMGHGVVDCWQTQAGATWTYDTSFAYSGTQVFRMVLDPTSPEPHGPLTGVVDVAGATPVACALVEDGTVRCAGASQYGQLGDGSSALGSRFVTVAGLTSATAVEVGGDHACVIRADRTVACWGRNVAGQLGDGTTQSRNTPGAVPGLGDVRVLAAGSQHTCALAGDGTVSCWGARLAVGQAGAGSVKSPLPVPGLSDVVSIEADPGATFTCARHADGMVSCWGQNQAGQLGDGTTTNRHAPAPVPGLAEVADLGVGRMHVCVARVDGTVACWGEGQLTPADVPGLADVIEVEGGDGRTCARPTDHNVWCWSGGSAPTLALFQ